MFHDEQDVTLRSPFIPKSSEEFENLTQYKQTKAEKVYREQSFFRVLGAIGGPMRDSAIKGLNKE